MCSCVHACLSADRYSSVPEKLNINTCIYEYYFGMKIAYITFFLLLSLFGLSYGQDTLTVMFYNLLNFPDGRDDCTPNMVIAGRYDTLRKIVQYVKPDLFLICELQNEKGADSILNRSLNQFGNYQRANFVTNQSGGPFLNNMLFYNSNKVSLYSQDEIITDLRDVNRYIVYGNDPNLSAHNDTTFIDLYVTHLKAGSSPSDESRRQLECDSIRSYIDALPAGRNHILTGDLNLKTSNETAYQTLINTGTYPFNDPINSPGNWYNNFAFTDIHTQSSRRTISMDCGALGGMNDRFDFILVTDNVLTGADRVQYLSNSYANLGNDGNHFNSSIIASPPNLSAPDSVINALYYMSDHLPVFMKIIITYPPDTVLNSNFTITLPSCPGFADAAIDLTVSGGTSPYTYLWSTGDTIQDITGLAAGTYSVIITDSINNTLNDTINISDPILLTTNIIGIDVCGGGNDGGADMTVSGGTSPYSYSWSTSDTTEDIAGIPAGTYTVIVTDSFGCTTSDSVTISTTAALTVNITDYTNVSCNGSTDGSATATPSGGTQPYTYSWSPTGGTDSIATGLLADTFFVDVTDVNSCTGTDTVIITEPAVFTATITDSTNVSCKGGSNGTAIVTASGGAPPYSYLWSNGGTDSIAIGLGAGTYTVTVTDANSCKANGGTPLSKCLEITSILIDACAPGGGWEGENEMVRFEVGSIDLDTADIFIDWPNNPWRGICQNSTTSAIVDSINANITAGGTVLEPVGGVLPAGAIVMIATSTNFDWATHDWSGLDYTIYLIFQCPGNTNGHFKNADCACGTCANDRTLIIQFGPSCADTVAYVPCDLQNAGVGGNGAAVDFDAPGNPTYLNIGCKPPVVLSTPPMSVTISEPATSLIVSIIDSVNIVCNGDSTGSATVTTSGGTPPYTWLWDDLAAQTDSIATGLTAGLYAVFVTDSNGCTGNDVVEITEPAAISSIISDSTMVLCFGDLTGSATVSVTGGTVSYNYLWNDPLSQTDSTATNLPTGAYTVLITDSNNCVDSASVTITQPATALSVNISDSNDALCYGDSSGSATVVVISGGAPSYSYLWNDPTLQTDSNATGLAAGTYTAVVTDANACTDSVSVTINQPMALTLVITDTNYANCGLSNGSATVTPSGATAPYTYLWSDPLSQTDSVATGLSSGPYTVTVTDTNLCTDSVSVNINDIGAPLINISDTTHIACFGDSVGSATVSATGGAPPYSILWNDPKAQTDSIADSLTAGSYTVSVTDSAGCTTLAAVIITQPLALTLSFSNIILVGCFGDSSGSATVSTTGGIQPYNYLWDDPNGQTDYIATGLVAGTYTVNVTDSNSCIDSISVTITQPAAALSLSITDTTNVACNGDSTGLATVTPTGGTTPYTYLWDDPNGQTDATATGLSAGNHTVIVTDTNNCIDSISITITQPAAALSLSITDTTNVACNGNSTGLATVTPTGGTAPYTYLWDDPNGQTDAAATGLSAGNYTVIVTDTNNCIDSISITIIQPAAALSLSITNTTNVACNGDSTGLATVTPTGGTAPYTYLWDDPNGQTDSTATALSAGTYQVIINDANNCSDSAVVNISQPPPISITETEIICNNDSIFLQGAWQNNAGTYLDTFLSVFGCDSLITTTLIVTQVFTIAKSSKICSYDSIFLQGAWQNTAGDYYDTVASVSGCDTVIVMTLTVNQVPTILSFSTINESGPNFADGSANVQVSGGTPSYSYLWDDSLSQTTDAATGLSAGLYIVTVTDANGCIDTAMVQISLEPGEEWHIFTGITPNSDDENNTWKIIKGSFKDVKLKATIYNRWGDLVWKSADYNNDWEGTNTKGDPLPDGTYFYIVDRGDKVFPGWVIITR
ncbi:MAG: T9SS type B sorting domain-containing protein [Cytophagales bacterium]|nr:T9SS type B sorting domain-containing protein [Cytophagales bacterium]